jgi:hypothetical protein
MSTLTSFPIFPTLPIEIRLKIWGIVLSTPRTVPMTCNKEPLHPGKRRAAKSFTSTCPPPALLHVNRETRYESLNIYAPHFKHPLSPIATYLNLSLDTIKFADGVLPYVEQALPVELGLIQCMTLETKDCAYFGHYNMEILKEMSGLRELEIVARRGAVYSWDRGEDFVEKIKMAFEDGRREDPGWICPRVTVMNGETGELGGVVEGGALIPGWTKE